MTRTETLSTTVHGSPMVITTQIVGPSGSLNPDAIGPGNRCAFLTSFLIFSTIYCCMIISLTCILLLYHRLSKGAIAGISLASAFAVGAVVLLVFFAYRRQLRKRSFDALGTGFFNIGEHGRVGFGSGSLGPGGATVGRGFRAAPLEDEDEDVEPSIRGDTDRELGLGVSPSDGGLAGYGPIAAVSEGAMGMDNSGEQATRLRGGMDELGMMAMEEGRRTGSFSRVSEDRAKSNSSRTGQFGITAEDLSRDSALWIAGVRNTASPAVSAVQRRASSVYSSGSASDAVGASSYGQRASFSITPYPAQTNTYQRPLPSPVGLAMTTDVPEYSAGEMGARASRHTSLSSYYSRTGVPSPVSGAPLHTLTTPPSAWTSSEKGKEKATCFDVGNSTSAETLARQSSRTSQEMSSNGHDNSRVMTSSQGHGSATGSGSHEKQSSGSVSSREVGGDGSGSSKTSHSRSKGHGRSASDGGGDGFVRTSLSSLRSRFRRSSQSIATSPQRTSHDDGSASPKPVSILPRRANTFTALSIQPSSPLYPQVQSRPPATSLTLPTSPHLRQFNLHSRQASGPIFGLVAAPSPGMTIPPRSPPSSLLRPHNPGVIPNFPSPTPAPRTALRQPWIGPALSVIESTPSPLPSTATPDGLLDPSLSTRLQEMRGMQASRSTIGLRDYEDYSRPIGGVSLNSSQLSPFRS